MLILTLILLSFLPTHIQARCSKGVRDVILEIKEMKILLGCTLMISATHNQGLMTLNFVTTLVVLFTKLKLM